MSVGVLLMSHPGVGSSLLHTAVRILGGCPLPVKCLEVPVGSDIMTISGVAEQQLDRLDTGDGVLILLDVYGATPSNIACRLSARHTLSMVSGVNLPMLMRVMNYAHDDLESLSQRATEGGMRGIQVCEWSPDPEPNP